MVCIVCNGKGYVTEKERELPCQECQGRGEYFFLRAPACQTVNLKNAAKLAVLEQFQHNMGQLF